MKHLLYLIILTHLFFCGCGHSNSTNPAWPEITSETKPWTRWWWQGSAVTKEGITAELESFKKAGLGGVEITPIYGVYGYEDQFINYLSPEWVDMLTHTLKEADRLGLGVDMATGTGWPFGGPWISEEDACKNMAYKIYELAAGESLNEQVVFQQEGFVRAVGNHIYETLGIYKVKGQPTHGTRESPAQIENKKPIRLEDINEPIEANENLQYLAIDQVQFKKKLPVHTLMAYSEAGEKINLTEKVNAEGVLDWTAPEGNWKLYAVFQGWHGKMVERAAPGGEGNVIDHFSKPALHNYLARFDDAFASADIGSLRAFFNDSYEVDDARGTADFTPALFEEFQQRKGYDLREHLPAFFAQDTEEKNERVLCDYRETISELLLENFTQAWKEWAHGKGALIRNQAHGSPANILDLYEAVDIPEMEGEDFLRIKMASSAANVSGKHLTGSESATWLNEHFLSNLADIKKSLDRFMLSGVNHVVYHGTSYSPKSEPWPGWLFYAAVHLNDRNPMWDDFTALNSYAARCQSFLQNTKPDNDILLYLPIYDRYSNPGREMLEHFDGVEHQFEGTAFKEAAEFMLAQGYSFDYISDKQIQKTRVIGKSLETSGGTKYKTIVIPQCKYIPLETIEKLIALAREGATVIAFKGLPEQVSGFYDLANRKEKFDELISEIQFEKSTAKSDSYRIGQGKILAGEDLHQSLANASVAREEMIDKGLQFIRKKSKSGTVYMIVNWGGEAVDDWVALQTPAKSAFLFDPKSGRFGKAKVKKEENIRVYLQIAPGETLLLETYGEDLKGEDFPVYEPVGIPIPLTGTWKISFANGGPKIPEPVETGSLGSWTNFDQPELKRFSGTATYSFRFEKPGTEAGQWLLDLGEVKESARIILNGQDIDTLWGPSFTTLIPGDLLNKSNLLEVKVSNLMANRISSMDKDSIFWKKFYNVNFPARLAENRKRSLFDASEWEPKESGLLGPAVLVPVQIKEF